MNDLPDPTLRALYPSMVNAPTPHAAQPRQTASEAAHEAEISKLYPSMQAKPEPDRPPLPEDHDDEDLADNLYPESQIYETAKRSIEVAMKTEMLATPEEAKAIAQEWEPSFRSFGLEPVDAEALTQIGISVALEPPSPAVVAGWQKDAKAELVNEYGDRAGEALQLAKKLIRRDPALAAFLDETQLGNHPNFVRVAAKKAMALNRKGRL